MEARPPGMYLASNSAFGIPHIVDAIFKNEIDKAMKTETN